MGKVFITEDWIDHVTPAVRLHVEKEGFFYSDRFEEVSFWQLEEFKRKADKALDRMIEKSKVGKI